MAQHALILGWRGATTGRASQAREVYGEWVNYWQTQLRDSKIERFTPVMLAHGQTQDVNGFFLIEGNIDTLQTLRWTDTFQDLFAKTAHVVDGFNLHFGYVNEGVQDTMTRWARYI